MLAATHSNWHKLIMNALLLIVLHLYFAALVEALIPSNVQFRNGKSSDERTIATTMFKELMNPLGIKADRFVVATVDDSSSDDSEQPIGWAQIRPLGTAKRDPSKFNARPGSYDLETEADDAMWDEFEQEQDTVVPVGLKSLPWTDEYRSFEEAAKRRRERRALLVEREGAKQPMLYELASVYVQPDYRGQGIGTELIKRVIQRHVDRGRSVSDIYLLTLATTVEWYYDSFGFDLVPEEQVPKQMSFEVAAGKLITRLIGAKLCCMRGVDT